jgi:phosphoglycerate dehydrogenase-like enzyme
MTERDDGPLRVLWRSRLGADEASAAQAPDGVRLRVAPDAPRGDLGDAEVLVDGDPPAWALDLPSLARVVVPYAGIRPSLREAIRERPHLTLHNSHFNAAFVAQHAVALLLACAARLGRYDRALRSGDWRRGDGPASLHLAGRRALLLGYGAIGQAAAPMLRGFGLELRAVRRRPDRMDDEVPQHGVDALPALLAETDVVIVSLPATDATRGLIDAAALAALPDGAVLVNVGRGDVLDEEATWEALQAGRLAGLGLDVWWRYPEDEAARAATLPSRRPFHLHPDVVLSPHRANAVEAWQRASVRDVFRTLAGIASGEAPARNQVDVDQGY